MSFAQKVKADMADSSGIAPRESVEFMSRQVGGRQNLGFIYDDYKNYLHSKRTREMKLGDIGGVLEYLQKMQLNDPNFFYAIQVDEDDLITNIFWADSRMMVDYDYFGDVMQQWPKHCLRSGHKHVIVYASGTYQNAAKQLKSVFENFNDFAKEFSSCIYDYEDEDDLLYAWNNMLQKYNLTDNDWLNRLFAIKEKWALVYGRQTFCVDITTTQRSESMNSAIKKYVNYKYDLLRFVKHFERLVDDRRYQELRAEFKASQSSPTLSFPVEILKHAAGIYTPAMLKWFQNELCKAHDCVLIFNGEIGSVRKYEIIPHRKNWHHTVTFDSTNNIVSCSCKKYDFAGILCAHALKVLSTRNITSIPTQYVLERWTKNIKSSSARVTINISSKDDPKANIVRRYKELCRLHIQLATRAAESPEAYEIAISRLNKTLGEVDACLKEKETQQPTQVNASELSETICIDDNVIQVRGIKTKEKVAGNSKRPRNALEKATKKKKPRNKELKYSTVDSVAGSIQTTLPHTPILQSVGQPNLMPGHMHFGEPFDFSQVTLL
nr:protein FAR1-RELATED SEQUENCE 5-like [Malus domestica]